MRRFLLAAAAGWLSASQLQRAGAGAPRRTTRRRFRSGVDLVTVSATVRDGKGRLVTDLTKRDFEVVDRGERRAISEFRTEPAPMSLAILFDVSGSMDVAARSTAAKFAAHHLLSWLQDGRDEAALFAFDSRLHEVAPFTVDTRALQGALGEVDPFGATSLHDAIAEAAERVATAANRAPRRRRADRRHRHRQPPDAGRGVGEGRGDRRAGLRHRRRCCRSTTRTRIAPRPAEAHGAGLGRHDRGPGALDGRRAVLQQHVGVGEQGGARR